MFTVQIRHRVIGTVRETAAAAETALDLLYEQITVAELIAGAVEEQVRDLLVNQRLDSEQAAAVLDRQYMTDEEIRQRAERGAVRYPGTKKPKALDAQAEVKRALSAFEKGAFMVVVDGQQAEALSDVATLSPASKITFLRLTPLVGG